MRKHMTLVMVTTLIMYGLAGAGTVSVTFDQTVHFAQPNGESVSVEAATYRVERSGETLRLIPEQQETAVVVQAEPLDLNMPVQEPTLLSLTRTTDEHLLIYADPKGDVLGTTGSYSGVRSRLPIPLKQTVAPKPLVSDLKQLPLPGGNVVPGILRLKSVNYTSFAQNNALVPFANINLSIIINNFALRPGTQIPYRIMSHNVGSCRFVKNPRINVQEAIAIQPNGDLHIAALGWFVGGGSYCEVKVELVLPGKAEPVTLVVPTPVTPPTRYTLSQTANLKEKLGFRINGTLGVCEGTSSFGAGSHPVGIITSNGDVALRIRSGPLGTECQYISKAWVLPDGVTVASVTWESSREIPLGQTQGKCCAVSAFGGNCMTMPPHIGLDFTRGTAPIVTGVITDGYYSVISSDPHILEDGVIIHDNASPRVVTILKPMWGKLQCVNTVLNDHGVQLVLRELVLQGPAGLTFP